MRNYLSESAKTKTKKNAKKDGGNGNELKLASKKHGSGSSSVHNPLPHSDVGKEKKSGDLSDKELKLITPLDDSSYFFLPRILLEATKEKKSLTEMIGYYCNDGPKKEGSARIAEKLLTSKFREELVKCMGEVLAKEVGVKCQVGYQMDGLMFILYLMGEQERKHPYGFCKKEMLKELIKIVGQ